MMLAIRVLLPLVVLFTLTGMPNASHASNNDQYAKRWLEVLGKGDSLEKRLALNRLNLNETRERSSFEHIFKALKDNDANVRLAAVDCLDNFARSNEESYGDIRYSLDVLSKKAECSDNSKKQVKTNRSSVYDARDIIVPQLINTLSDPDPRVRAEAAIVLIYYRDERSIDALMNSLSDVDPWVRLNAVHAFNMLEPRRSVDGLLKVLSDDSDWRNKYVQQEAVLALSGLPIRYNRDERKRHEEYMRSGPTFPKRGEGRETPTGMDGYVTPKAQERAKADDLLAEKIISGFVKKSSDPYLKRMLLKIFGSMGEMRDYLVEATSDPDILIRQTAVETLAGLDRRLPFNSKIKTKEQKKEGLPEVISQNMVGSNTLTTASQSVVNNDESFNIFKKSLSDASPDIRAGAVKGLGNTGDPRAVDLLIAALQDTSKVVKINAVAGLSRLGDSKAIDPLIKTLSLNRTGMSERSPLGVVSVPQVGDAGVDEAVLEALSEFSGDEILDAVAPYLTTRGLTKIAARTFKSAATNGENDRVFVYRKNGTRYVTKNRSEAASDWDFSSRIVNPHAVKLLTDIFENSNQGGHSEAYELLDKFEDPAIERLMIRLLGHPSVSVRLRAIQRIPASSGDSVIPLLLKVAEEGDPSLRSAAVNALRVFQNETVLKWLVGKLQDEDKSLRASAADALNYYPGPVPGANVDPQIVNLLMRCLKDPDLQTVVCSVKALGKVRANASVDSLIAVLSAEIEKPNQNVYLMREVITALTKIGDRKALPALIKAFTITDLQGDLIQSYATMADARAVSNLAGYLKDEKVKFRVGAIEVLGNIGGDDALNALISSLNCRYYIGLVVSTIGKNFPGDKAYDVLVEKLSDANVEASTAAAMALAERKDKRPLRLLLRHAGKMPEDASGIASSLSLGMLVDDTNILSGYVDDNDSEVRKGAVQIISLIEEDNKRIRLLREGIARNSGFKKK